MKRRGYTPRSYRSQPPSREVFPELSVDPGREEREARRARDFAELVALARAPLVASVEVDEPDRVGAVRWNDDQEDEVPERIADDAKPVDLARETQARRERQRARGDGVAFDPKTRRTVVTQRGLAAAALGELRRLVPRPEAP